MHVQNNKVNTKVVRTISAKTEEKIQLELQGRDWAAKVFCITRLVFAIAKTTVERITNKTLAQELEDSQQVNTEFKDITDSTIRLKELARTTLLGYDAK